jgi:hypothetical protein
MSEIRDIPAFPVEVIYTQENERFNGMTLRDYFARGAIQGLLNNGMHPNMYQLARDAYAIADALLVIRAEDE